MRKITTMLLVAGWITASFACNASEPLLRILKGSLSQGGLFRLQMASNTLPYEVQASTNLVQWLPLQTNLATGSLAEFVDANSKAFRQRFYRLTEHRSGLALSTTNANPGDKLAITGGPFDPTARTLVQFSGATGLAVNVRAFTVTTDTVEVAIPFMVNSSLPQVHGGMVEVSVEQQTAGATVVAESPQQLRIGDLPSVALTAGAVTMDYLNQMFNLLDIASSRWQTIEMASQGKLDTTALRLNLRSMQTNVVAARRLIQSIINGQTPRISLGRIHDREVILDVDSVTLLDRMIVASLNYRSHTTWLARSSILSLESDGIPSRIGETFNPGQSSQSTFDLFDQFNSVGGMSVGILATTAVVLGIATAPAAVAMAGTAGAILFFSTYVAPAVMGASALSLAAPFIEVQTGQQVALEDYRPALNHIQKGSQAYLYDEVQGNLFNGILASQGASEELIAQSSLFISTSKSILDNLDFNNRQSIGSLALANSETIFASLRLTNDLVEYSAILAKTFNSTYPDGGWEEQLTATIAISLRGQGTLAAPFSGTFVFDGTILEKLLYCHSVDVPCDPGGAYVLKLDNGVVSGSMGIVTADGTGTLTSEDGTAPFPFQFIAGVLNENTLTGTLVLGDFEQWLVVLTKR